MRTRTHRQQAVSRQNAATMNQRNWINKATNKQLLQDGSVHATDELARRKSPVYYSQDDPRRAHWESQDLPSVKGT